MTHEKIYRLTYRPHRFEIKERTSPSTSYVYWDIVDTNCGHPVAFAFHEEWAKQIAFALDYATAVLNGDASAQMELARAMGKLHVQ